MIRRWSKNLAVILFASFLPLWGAVTISVSPTTATVNQGSARTFAATVSGSTNTAVTWSVTTSGGGAVDASGVYTAPMTAGTYKVRATSQADALKYAEATMTVPAITVTVTPSTATVVQGGTKSFTATVNGAANTAVIWSVTTAGGGTIDASGGYAAPTTAGIYKVRATSQADSLKYKEATVTVPAITVSVNPSTATVVQGGTQSFTATVNGTANTSVSWSVTTAGGGTIDASGVYAAPLKAGIYKVRAISQADSLKYKEATVTVPAITVSVNPSTATVVRGGSQSFTSSVNGAANTAVTWSVTTTGGGTVDASGVYTAPLNAGSFTVRATSQANAAKYAEATVTVPAVVVTLSPATASVIQGGTKTFKATVTGAGNTAVSWSASIGTIDAGGIYTAPATSGTCTITATSSADSSKTGTATVTVPAVTISASPTVVTLGPGAAQSYTAKVNGTTNTAVTWAASGGSISTTGDFVAPTTPGLYTITATSSANTAKISTVKAVVTVDGMIDVSGTFTSPQGNPLLFQSGTSINGSWDSTNYLGYLANITGSLTGNVLFGSWNSADGTASGKFTVTFAADGGSFIGTFGYGPSDADGGDWTGTRKSNVVSVQMIPGSAVLKPGITQVFQALVAGAFVKTVTWTTTAGTVDQDGTFVAPLVPGLCTVKATSTAKITASASAPVVVTTDGFLDVSGTYVGPQGNPTFFQNGTQIQGTWDSTSYLGYMANITGSLIGNVLTGSWISADGTVSGKFTIIFAADGGSFIGTFGNGQSDADGGEWTGVRQNGVVSVKLIPSSAVLKPGAMQAFQALVAGAYVKTITWTTTSGTIGQDGIFVAPLVPGLCTVKATSAAQTTANASAPVVVTTDGFLDVSGTFTGLQGIPTFFQNGTQILGTWDSTSYLGYVSNLTGSLNGNVLTGSWNSPDGLTGGKFNLTFAADGASFSGTFGYGTSDSDGGEWTGTRQNGVVSVRVLPEASILQPSGTQAFQALVAGSYVKDVTWNTTGGSITPQGMFTAPNTLGVCTLKATSTAATTKSASVPVVISADGQIDVSGTFACPQGNAVLFQSGNQVQGEWDNAASYGVTSRFTGTLNGRTLTGSWSTADNNYSGLFTLTYSADGASFLGSFGNGASNSDSGEWTGMRQPGVVTLKVLPANAVLAPGATLQFQGLVAGSYEKTINWVAKGGGVIAADGTYTAPTAPGFYTIEATPTADVTQKIIASIEVTIDGKQDVSGVFSTTFGDMVLFQSGIGVTGTWANSQVGGACQFNGTLQNGTVTGTWLADADVYQNGGFSFQFAADGSNFNGSYGNGPSSTDYLMTGTRQNGVVQIRLDPKSAFLAPGGSQTLIALVAGSPDKAIVWSTTNGVLTGSGTSVRFTAPFQEDTVTVTAMSPNIPGIQAQSTLVVTGGISVAISPKNAVMRPSMQKQFSAIVTGVADQAVTWTASTGTIDGTGLYTAPSWPCTDTITAMSQIDTSKMTSTTVTVSAAPTIVRFAASPATIPVGNSSVLSWTVTGATSVSLDNGIGDVSSLSSKNITPIQNTTYTLTATNESGGVTAPLTVQVLAPKATLSISPRSIILGPGCATTFATTAYVQGGSDASLVWTATGGNITPNGSTALYVAPTAPGTYLVQVRATADPRPQDGTTAVVTVIAGGGGIPPGGGGPGSSTTVSVSLYPKTIQLNAGQKFVFQATVDGNSNTAIDWRLASEKGDATLNQSGEFQAVRPGTYQVIGISQADPSAQDAAQVVVKSITEDRGAISQYASMVELPDGRFFIAGGVYDKRTYFFDPETKLTSPAGEMSIFRVLPALSRHSDTEVMISGGETEIEFYSTNNGIFTLKTPSVNAANCGGFNPLSYLLWPQSGPWWHNKSGIAMRWPQPQNQATATDNSFNESPTLVAFSLMGTADGLNMVPFEMGSNSFTQLLYFDESYRNEFNTMKARYDCWTTTGYGGGIANLNLNNVMIESNNSCMGFWQGWNWIMVFGIPRYYQVNDNGVMWTTPTDHTYNNYGCGVWNNGNLLLLGDWYKLSSHWMSYIENDGGLSNIASCDPIDLGTHMAAATFDIATNKWNKISTMPQFHIRPSFCDLGDGRMLISGGYESEGGGTRKYYPVIKAQIFDSTTAQFSLTGAMKQPRYGHKTVLLPDGRVLVVGGFQLGEDGEWGHLANLVEIFDPTTGTFEAIEKLTYGIIPSQLLVNKNGRVFMSGYRFPLAPDSIDQTTSALLKTKAGLSMALDATDFTNGSVLVEIELKPREIPVQIKFPKFWPSSEGVYDFVKRPVPTIPAECVKVAINDATGERWCGYTDESGHLSIPLEGDSNPASFLVSEVGKAFTIVLKPETQVDFGNGTLARASVKKGRFIDASATDLTFTIKSLVGGDKNIEDPIEYTAKDFSTTREAGPINMLWVYRRVLKYLGSSAAPAFNDFQFWWDPDKDDDGITRFSTSMGNHVYVRANRNVNADDFDDGVLLHEMAHKAHMAFGPYRPMPTFGGALSSGHSGKFSIDPELAWVEGWANFFQAAVKQSNEYPVGKRYTKMFDSGANGGKTNPLIDPDGGGYVPDLPRWANEIRISQASYQAFKNVAIGNKSIAAFTSKLTPGYEMDSFRSFLDRLGPDSIPAISAILSNEGFTLPCPTPMDAPATLILNIPSAPFRLLPQTQIPDSSDFMLPREGSAFFKCTTGNGDLSIRVQGLTLGDVPKLGIRVTAVDTDGKTLDLPLQATSELYSSETRMLELKLDRASGWAEMSLGLLTLYNLGQSGTMSNLIVTIAK